MKRALALLLAFVMMFALCGCGSKKSEKVMEVERLISELGDITSESGEKLNKAKSAYEELSDKERKNVENYEVLCAYEDDYNKKYMIVGNAYLGYALDIMDSDANIVNMGNRLFVSMGDNIRESYVIIEDGNKRIKYKNEYGEYVGTLSVDTEKLFESDTFSAEKVDYAVTWDTIPTIIEGMSTTSWSLNVGMDDGIVQLCFGVNGDRDYSESCNRVDWLFDNSEYGFFGKYMIVH